MVATPYNKKANPVFLVDQTTGEPYAATGVAGGPAVTIADGADVTQGDKDDAAATAGDASATNNALLKGILAALGDASDAAGDNTVIGQLKQIAVNTTPAP